MIPPSMRGPLASRWLKPWSWQALRAVVQKRNSAAGISHLWPDTFASDPI